VLNIKQEHHYLISDFFIFVLQSLTLFSLPFRQKRGCNDQIMAGESLHLLRWEHCSQLLVKIEFDLLF